MLNWIIRRSLEHSLLVLCCALLLVFAGFHAMQRMDIDVFPDLTAPTVVVMTDAHGMSSEEVERLVTYPVETAVNGATDVRRVRSTSSQGFSFVWIEFDWGTDVFRARQIVSEKMVTLAESLPEGLTPVLAPQSSVMGEILFVGLQADSTSMADLRTMADWLVKPAILATGGVSQVTIIGGDCRQYQILADPLRMAAFGVTLEDIETAGRSVGENSEGGVIRDYGNEFTLRGIGRTADVEEMGQTFVKWFNGRPVVLSDVAEVRIGAAPKYGFASHNARPAVILSVSKQPDINTLRVTHAIEQHLEELRPSLPPDVVMDTHIFRQADFISAAVGNVGRSLVEGAVFVVLVLCIFLASFRTTFISVLAIPLSLLGTMVVLRLMGMNINTMTLGGMCIAIGSLVDDAIIDVENVYKRLRENHARPAAERRPSLEVVFDASREIRMSIIHATFIIMLSFLPLFFLSGMEGRMLKPLGIAYIVSLFVSLCVAMTVTPVLCRGMLSSDKYLTRKEKSDGIAARLTARYAASLRRALGGRRTLLTVTVVLLAAAVVLFFRMGRSFLPDFNEGSLTIAAVVKPGVSLEENDAIGHLIEQKLLAIPGVTSTSRRTGRGELDEHSQATNSAEIDVNFEGHGRDKDVMLREVRHALADIPGIAVSVGQPLGHRIDHMLSGSSAQIAIKLFGTDLSRMYLTANQIKRAIQDVEGLVDVSVEQQTETPQLQIRPNRALLARYGIPMETFHRFVSSAFAGEKVADIYEGQRRFDLVVRLGDAYAGSVEHVRKALMDTHDGGKVPLEEVADIVSTSGPNAISRENVQRKIVISANAAGRDIGSVVDDIRERVEEHVQLPEGYSLSYGGQFESAAAASRTLAVMSLLALAVIFLLLYVEFKDLALSGIVLINLPLALIGGVVAVRLSSGVVSIPSVIGFITLFGIATRNGILLVSRYEHLAEESNASLEERIVAGSTDRLLPILMTALTSALALIPMILSGAKSGNEIQSPMAVVVLGGLVTSTLLNIYVVPVVYAWFRSRRQPRNTQNSMQ